MKDKAFKVIGYIVAYIFIGLAGYGIFLSIYVIKLFPLPEIFFGRIILAPIMLISALTCLISYFWLLRKICKIFKPFDDWYEKKTGIKMDISTFLDGFPIIGNKQ